MRQSKRDFSFFSSVPALYNRLFDAEETVVFIMQRGGYFGCPKTTKHVQFPFEDFKTNFIS